MNFSITKTNEAEICLNNYFHGKIQPKLFFVDMVDFFACEVTALFRTKNFPYSACINSKVYVSKFPYSGEEHY